MPIFEFPEPHLADRIGKVLSTHPEFSNRIVDVTAATIALSEAAHDGRTILIGAVAGTTVTLPKSTGRGCKIHIKVKTLATSNSHIVKVQNTTDVMSGSIVITDTDTAGTATAFATAASSDTVTLNRSTTGSVTIGEWVEFEDIAVGFWAVRGTLSNTGSGATPFSATV